MPYKYEVLIELPGSYGEQRTIEIAQSLIRGRGTMTAEVYAVDKVTPEPVQEERREYLFTAEA